MKTNKNVKTFIGLIVLLIVIVVLVVAYDRLSQGDSSTRETTEEAGERNMDGEAPVQIEDRIMIGVPEPLEDQDVAYIYNEQSGELTKVPQPIGWRVTELRQEPEVEFEDVLNDPSAIRMKIGDSWDLVLRDQHSTPYQNPSFIGFVDEATVAIRAEKDERYILFVKAGGGIQEVFELPALYKVHGVFGNAVWLTTALPGDGLEAEPQGPAHVIRIDGDGGESLISEDKVIEQLVAHEGGSYAYRFTDGSYKARRGGFLWEGSGTPLYWLNEEELLVNQGSTLKRVHLTDSAQDTVGELEGAATIADRVQFIAE